MDFTSTGFLLFTALTVLIFYLFPQNKKWVVLLVSSYVFYALSSFKGLVFIFLSTVLSFLAAKKISALTEKCDEKIANDTDAISEPNEKKQLKKKIRADFKRKKKIVLTLVLLACFGLLAVLKYSNFAVESLNSIFKLKIPLCNFILPLGISFYTFQIASYIFDVYYGKYDSEKNFFHYALYVSYFPSIVQGPINRFNDLKKEFFETEHYFSLQETQFALQRIFWGLLKKLVIADRAADVVTYFFENHASLPWYMTFFGLFFYSIKLYADFSGAMDVTIGISNLMGIKLAENFRQPFFSQSISEFWRRWHITLGTWMKDYIFYPFSISKFCNKITTRLAQKHKILARTIPASIGNLIVFLIVGVWHGAEWHYVFYGLYNAFLIILEIVFKPLFDKMIKLLHINDKAFYWRIFRTLRTFFLVNLGWVFDDDTTGLPMSFSMLKRAFSFGTGSLATNYNPLTYTNLTIFTVLFFTGVWFIGSVLTERGVNVRQKIASFPLPIRWGFYLALILAIPFFQAANTAGFIYAQF